MEALAAAHPLKCFIPKARMFLVLLCMVLGTALLCLLQLRLSKPRAKDFYSFQAKDLRGRLVPLAKYRGKAALVVNVASQCQHTERSYRELQALHRELGPSHFTVLAFPCNQFGDCEPGSNQDIAAFAKGNYGVTFPIFGKIKILGSEAEPAFRFITDSVKKEPRWNFWKYLINPEGKVVKFWRPEESIESIKPEVVSLVRAIIMKKKEDL